MKNIKYFLVFVVGTTLFGMETQEFEKQQHIYDMCWELHWAPRAVLHEMINNPERNKYIDFGEQFEQLDLKGQEEIIKKLHDISKDNPENKSLLSFRKGTHLRLKYTSNH
jgi:hypothetical protein